MIKFLVGWTVFAIFLFATLELTIPAGSQIKKWPRRVLFVIYLPLYIIGGIFFVIYKVWTLLNGNRENDVEVQSA